MRRLTLLRIAPKTQRDGKALRAACRQLSILLRTDAGLMRRLGIPFAERPRTAEIALQSARRWCRRHDASFHAIVSGGRVVGGLTEKPEKAACWLGSRFGRHRAGLKRLVGIV